MEVDKLKDGDILASSIETYFDCLRVQKRLAASGVYIQVEKSPEHISGLATMKQKYTPEAGDY